LATFELELELGIQLALIAGIGETRVPVLSQVHEESIGAIEEHSKSGPIRRLDPNLAKRFARVRRKETPQFCDRRECCLVTIYGELKSQPIASLFAVRLPT
jgi:hypothetical protein